MFRKVLGLSLVLLASPALAGDISYNYLQLGYEKIEFDDVDADGDGFGIGGSFEVGESWFVAVSYSQADLDTDIGFSVSVDFDQIAAGVGWHTAMSNNSDFYALVQYVQLEASISGFDSADEDGIGAVIGVRGMVTDNVEIGGSIGYIDLGDAGDGTAFGANVLYNFTENFAAGLFLEIDEDVTGYGAGIRFYW